MLGTGRDVHPEQQCLVPLQWDAFVKWYNDQEMENDTLSFTSKAFTVNNTSFTSSVLQLTSYLNELNTDVKKDIQTDPYIEQAFLILLDLINTKN